MRARINFLESGCWEWENYRSPDGYGRCHWDGASGRVAHRVLFEQINGPLAPDVDLHHTCGNRACIRPDHLEPMPHGEHSRLNPRGARTVCDHGHQYTAENTYFRPSGFRDCRACIRERAANYRARRAAA